MIEKQDAHILSLRQIQASSEKASAIRESDLHGQIVQLEESLIQLTKEKDILFGEASDAMKKVEMNVNLSLENNRSAIDDLTAKLVKIHMSYYASMTVAKENQGNTLEKIKNQGVLLAKIEKLIQRSDRDINKQVLLLPERVSESQLRYPC